MSARVITLGPTQFRPGGDAELLAVIRDPLTWGEKQDIRDEALSACDKLEAAARNAAAQLRLTPQARMLLVAALEEAECVHRAAMKLGGEKGG